MLALAVGRVVLDGGGVVGHGDDEDLQEERGGGRGGGALAHDRGEVAARGGAARGLLGEVEREERGAEGLGPENGFPGIVDGGGVGVFGCES